MANKSCVGYAGYYEDAVIGGYPLGNGYRVYLPSIMRFTAPDSESPFGKGGLNPYTYCQDEPINSSDPSGHIRPDSIDLPETDTAAQIPSTLVRRARQSLGDLGRSASDPVRSLSNLGRNIRARLWRIGGRSTASSTEELAIEILEYRHPIRSIHAVRKAVIKELNQTLTSNMTGQFLTTNQVMSVPSYETATTLPTTPPTTGFRWIFDHNAAAELPWMIDNNSPGPAAEWNMAPYPYENVMWENNYEGAQTSGNIGLMQAMLLDYRHEYPEDISKNAERPSWRKSIFPFYRPRFLVEPTPIYPRRIFHQLFQPYGAKS